MMIDEEEEYKVLFLQHQRIIDDQQIQLKLKNEEIMQLCEKIEECENRLIETQSLVLNLATQVNPEQKQARGFFTFEKRRKGNKKFISIV